MSVHSVDIAQHSLIREFCKRGNESSIKTPHVIADEANFSWAANFGIWPVFKECCTIFDRMFPYW